MVYNRQLQLDVSFPFCTRKSGIFHGPVFEGQSYALMHEYFKALGREITSVASEANGYDITGVYLGEGPLNAASCTDWQLLIKTLKSSFDLKNAEINICFSPDNLTTDDYFRFYSEECDWLMLNMVSHVPGELEAAGVAHSVKDNAKAHLLFCDFGFKQFDVVLYYGIPGQTPESLLVSLERAINMFGRHISLLPWPSSSNDESLAIMRKTGYDYLAGKAFEAYTPGRFGKDGARIRMYSQPAGEHMGLGLGALSYMDGLRFCNTGNMELYLQHSDQYDLICNRLG